MSTLRRILMVDDDALLRHSLVDQFAAYSEFAVLEAENIASSLAAVGKAHIDLIIMDINLPDGDGREAVKRLRMEGFQKPIILLTGHDSETDIVCGLESGANDYVNKPFKFAVLLARIRVQLRQHEMSEDATFQIGSYVFFPSGKLLTSTGGEKSRLTEKEAAILLYLYRAKGIVVSRDELLREVWGYNANIKTHTLETHIYRLRQKIEASPANSQMLVSNAGGYRLSF